LRFQQEHAVARTGFIDHIGIGVSDLAAAKRYYDELMPILGLREWFRTSPGGPFNYGPDGAKGSQIFFYQARDQAKYSRRRTGLHHVCFFVETRAAVREAYEWARSRKAVVLRRPRVFPEYGTDFYATFWLDPHGIMLGAVSYAPEVEEVAAGSR
jgi:catechol 2,3-dioxygenase-like lactoylglutathione lyase family enzyme